MATCRDVIVRALRMTGVIGRGDEPEADEAQDAMIVLQSLYDQWLIGGMFGRLRDTYETGDYDAQAGQRVFVTDGVVTLPVITDECPWRDLAAIEVNDDNGRKVWLWDRTEWVRIDNLTMDDEAPLAERGMNGLAACLAMACAEEYGNVLMGAGVVAQANAFRSALFYKMGSTQDIVPGVYF